MHYIKIDQIISMIAKHESGALMAKFDVEAAYRNIAVHPEDRYLLGGAYIHTYINFIFSRIYRVARNKLISPRKKKM